jgi:hypothetical protein
MELQLFAPRNCYIFQSNRLFITIQRSKNQNSKILIPRIIILHPPYFTYKKEVRNRERERKKKRGKNEKKNQN